MKQRIENKWDKIPKGKYKITDLGRPAVFLIPVRKLRGSVRKKLEAFLMKEYKAFTLFRVPSFGVWKDGREEVITDACYMYEVAILGKDRVKPLLEKLAEVAQSIEEECIYVKAGQYAALVYPKAN